MAPEALASGVADASHLDSLQTKCQMFYHLFHATKDPIFLQAIKDTLVDASPNLRFGPHANDDGESSFLAFNVIIPLDDEKIANLIEIVKPQIPETIQLQPALIRAVHEVMCVEKISDQTFGDLFPQSALAYFLEFCHTTIELPCDRDSLISKVHHALKASIMHARHSIGSAPRWTSSNHGKLAEDDEAVASFKQFLSALVVYIEHVQQHGRKFAQDNAHTANGILKHHSMDELVRLLNEASDVHTMELVTSQIHALDVAAIAVKVAAVLGRFDDIVEVINKYLQNE